MSNQPDFGDSVAQDIQEINGLLASVDSSPPQASPPPPSKRRKSVSSTPTATIRWTIDMIEELLKAKARHRNFFLDAKNRNQLKIGWSKVILDVTTRFGCELSEVQVKNKYNGLQTTYRQVRGQGTDTGNNPAAPKPICWAAKVEHFGNRQGQAHECLNSQPVAIVSVECDDDKPANQSEDGKPANQSEPSTQRQRPNRERSLPFDSLGSDIKQGLQDLGRLLVSDGDDGAVKDMLKTQQQLLQQTNQLLQENKAQTEKPQQLSAGTVALSTKFVEKQ